MAAARHGLQYAPAPVLVSHDEAQTVLDLARHDHLTGFLAAAVSAGEVIVDDHLSIATSWHQELLACVVLEALAVKTGEILDTAGVRWRLTKGAALAHLDYPDPALRTFGDVDLIVHPDDWLDALEALIGADYRREADPIGGDYDRRYGKGVTLTTPDGLELDLHRRLAIGRFGVTSHTESLFEPTEHIILAGRRIPVLAAAHRLLHACYHATLGGYQRLRALRDVAQLALVTQAHWRSTIATALSWDGEAVVATAVKEAWEVLRLDLTHPLHDWAMCHPISRGDQRAIRLFTEERAFSLQALTAIPRLPRADAPRYLWTLASHRVHRSRRAEAEG